MNAGISENFKSALNYAFFDTRIDTIYEKNLSISIILRLIPNEILRKYKIEAPYVHAVVAVCLFSADKFDIGHFVYKTYVQNY